MKYRVTDIMLLLLSATLLFCGCSPEPATEAVDASAELPVYTETETLYRPDQSTLRQNMELTYDGNGSLIQENRTQYDAHGNLSYLATTEFDESGAAAVYEEKHYDPSGRKPRPASTRMAIKISKPLRNLISMEK